MTGIRTLLLLLLPATLLAVAPDVATLVRQGIAEQVAGRHRDAVTTLERAVALAEKSGNQPLLLLAKSSLGAVCTCSRQADQAEKNLRESLALADQLHDAATAGIVWNNLGNLLAAQGQSSNALTAFAEAARQPSIASKANANAAAVALRADRLADAEQLNSAALVALAGQPITDETALLWLRCGTTDLTLKQIDRAEHAFRQALSNATPRVQTYALGYLGQLKQSLDLTRQAAFLAQANDLPEALYRWEWQTGRLLAAAGKREQAIAAYRRAVQTLQPIRAALTTGCGAARPSFREAVAPVYYELADLLLQDEGRARPPGAPSRPEELAQNGAPGGRALPTNMLAEARDTIEQLKVAELDDYLQDECAATPRNAKAKAEKIAQQTAIMHIIPLADRTEILLEFTTGLERVRIPVTAAQLTAEVRKFRLSLERRTTNQYLGPAQQLYTWLITPVRAKLLARQIETLVFVPDGALRTVPLAALHDGARFLIEQFACAVAPGVALVDARPLSRGPIGAVAAGLSEATQNFAPLPGVPAELQAVAAAFQAPVLLNQQFTVATLQKKFSQHQFQVVHFATHGQVDKDITRSFILTHDGRLTLDDLEALLRPAQFRGHPVELLTLSACQTAAGDDRAALGLAGVALKAGARSALATLWFVNDESTTLLMEEFYRDVKTTSKAKALQQAQVKVLRDPRFGHAGYWAAYLLIGNWL